MVELDTMDQRLSKKEEELKRVKKLLLEKLKEIETSFQELSHEMEEVPPRGGERNAPTELERSVENIIGRYEDEQREQELDRLIKANDELQRENTELSLKIKELESTQKKGQQADRHTLKDYEERLDELMKERNKLIADCDKEKSAKEKLKKERDQAVKEASESRRRLELSEIEESKRE